MIIKILILLVILVAMTGCAPKAVPLAYNCPTITLPPDPIPVIRKLTAKSRPDEVMKAWVETAYQYRGWNQAVRNQIESSH